MSTRPRSAPRLHNPLPGDARTFAYSKGDIYYKVGGAADAPPVVLIHGVGAGASSYEWRENFGALAAEFRVYAYDLLGFGLSAHPDIAYSADLYIELLAAFLREVVGQPAHIVAAANAAGYAIQVALHQPDLIRSMVLIAPAGKDATGEMRAPNITGGGSYDLLRRPAIGQNLFNLAASRAGIAYFLRAHLYYDPSLVTDEMLDNYYAAAHQPGAYIAPMAFFAGKLNAEIGQSFAKVMQPTLLVWGREANVSPVRDGYRLLKRNPHARLAVFTRSRLSSNEERPAPFNRLAAEFLHDPAALILQRTDDYEIVA